jgi:hypothetical protein
MSIHDALFSVRGQFADERQAIKDLAALEETYTESLWVHSNQREPLVGDQSCNHLAQKYGLSRRSCLTVFIDARDDTACKCRFERCFPLTFNNIDGALKHLRQHHFDHRPFICLPTNGTTW